MESGHAFRNESTIFAAAGPGRPAPCGRIPAPPTPPFPPRGARCGRHGPYRPWPGVNTPPRYSRGSSYCPAEWRTVVGPGHLSVRSAQGFSAAALQFPLRRLFQEIQQQIDMGIKQGRFGLCDLHQRVRRVCHDGGILVTEQSDNTMQEPRIPPDLVGHGPGGTGNPAIAILDGDHAVLKPSLSFPGHLRHGTAAWFRRLRRLLCRSIAGCLVRIGGRRHFSLRLRSRRLALC
jgi:hypothetical protein